VGLAARIAKAQQQKQPTGTMSVTAQQPTGQHVSEWVRRAQEGATIGQPITDKGIPAKATGGTV
jgi:hypothetical protein